MGYPGGGDGGQFLPTTEGEASEKTVSAVLHSERTVHSGQEVQCGWHPLGHAVGSKKKKGGQTHVYISVEIVL